MAIRIDDRAQAAIARRRARGRDATIQVHLAGIAARGGMQQIVAGWAARAASARLPIRRQVGDATLQVGARIAHYADWHDLTISAWRLGPLEQLRVVDEPRVTLELLAWERTHPYTMASAEAGR